MTEYNLAGLNFLVIEDNGHMRALIRGILTALGAENVVDALDGAHGFEQLRRFSADIIICDWHMSPLDGISFVRRVRTGKDSPNPFVPIIMLSGHTELHRVAEARDSGIHEFLAKPISAMGLYSRIRSIIKRAPPFVRVPGPKGYFGPDRRRRQLPGYEGPERRQGAGEEKGEGGLDQDEVEALLNS